MLQLFWPMPASQARSRACADSRTGGAAGVGSISFCDYASAIPQIIANRMGKPHEEIASDTAKHSKAAGWSGGTFKNSERYESNLTAMDPLPGEVKGSPHFRYPNYSGALSTGGGLVFIGLLNGMVAAPVRSTRFQSEYPGRRIPGDNSGFATAPG